MFKTNYAVLLYALISVLTLTSFNLMSTKDFVEPVESIQRSTSTPMFKLAADNNQVEPSSSIEEPVVETVQAMKTAAPIVLTIEERLAAMSVENIYAKEAIYLAKTMWGEARGCSTTEQAAVAWCILNRVDANGFPDDIIKVITQKYQFHGYRDSFPVTDELYELAIDILGRWELEKAGYDNVGRILPKNYYYFHGDGKHNYFRTEYRGKEYWDWSLESPYEV